MDAHSMSKLAMASVRRPVTTDTHQLHAVHNQSVVETIQPTPYDEQVTFLMYSCDNISLC